MGKTLNRDAPVREEHGMSKRNEATSNDHVEWDEVASPAISLDARRAAYESISESTWKEFAAYPLVAITVRSPKIIAGGDDPIELSKLDTNFGVVEIDYFIAPSKFYKIQNVSPRKTVA